MRSVIAWRRDRGPNVGDLNVAHDLVALGPHVGDLSVAHDLVALGPHVGDLPAPGHDDVRRGASDRQLAPMQRGVVTAADGA